MERTVRARRDDGLLDTVFLVQCEHEQATVFQVVELHRVQVASAGLHGSALRANLEGDRCALERRAEVDAPELFERVVVVGD